MHLWVSAPPKMAPAEIMRRIKGRTSSKLFEEYPHRKKRYWGRHFWARGYFCVTAGELTREMIQVYLEHHFEPRPEDDFEVEEEPALAGVRTFSPPPDSIGFSRWSFNSRGSWETGEVVALQGTHLKSNPRAYLFSRGQVKTGFHAPKPYNTVDTFYK